jgi:hypothetical protein
LRKYAGLLEATVWDGKQDTRVSAGCWRGTVEARLARVLEEGREKGQFQFKGGGEADGGHNLCLTLALRCGHLHSRRHALYERGNICIEDYEASLKRDTALIRSHAGTPKEVNIFGYFYNFNTGTLTEVVTDKAEAVQQV